MPRLDRGMTVEIYNLSLNPQPEELNLILDVMPRLDRGIQGRPEQFLVALDCPVKPGNDSGG
jgi:hypothetical protein